MRNSGRKHAPPQTRLRAHARYHFTSVVAIASHSQLAGRHNILCFAAVLVGKMAKSLKSLKGKLNIIVLIGLSRIFRQSRLAGFRLDPPFFAAAPVQLQ